MSLIKNPIDLARSAAAEYQAFYGPDLIAVLLYGSAAGADFDPARSDMNLLIILKTMDLASIRESFEVQEKLVRKRFAYPLIMSTDYISRSLDSFPIEFLNIKGCNKALVGPDLAASWQINPADVRLQCERELKGKWLHLMHDWLRAGNKPARQLSLAQISLKDFAVIFRALLFLNSTPAPGTRFQLFDAIEKAYSLTDKPFERLANACSEKNKQRIPVLFEYYTNAIKKIIDRIDQHSTRENV